MKKILIFIFVFIISLQTASAKNYTLKFNGEKYTLMYSAKNKDFGGYINEYFKPRETYNIWTEMIAVHHFPNAYSPIDRIKDFKDYLGSMNVPSSLTFDDSKNTAMIDFILISDKQMPIVMEFNIFKYEKSKKCGSIAVQYAKRYAASTTLQIEQIKADFEKNRKNLIKQVKKLEIPVIIDEDIDKCISAIGIKNQTDNEIKQEKEAQAQKEKEMEKAANAEKLEEDTKTEISKEIEINQEKEANTKDNTDENTAISKNEIKENIIEEQTEKTEDKTTESEDKKITEQEKEDDAAAPVPAEAAVVEKEKAINDHAKDKKKTKNVNYEVKNSKDKYYAQPRTRKELKNEVKQNKNKQKQLKKDAKKQAKIDKINSKKQIKSAKKAEKTSQEIKNKNTELIAEPRTKKELKKQSKMLKKQAKERAKQAKIKLSE